MKDAGVTYRRWNEEMNHDSSARRRCNNKHSKFKVLIHKQTD